MNRFVPSVLGLALTGCGGITPPQPAAVAVAAEVPVTIVYRGTQCPKPPRPGHVLAFSGAQWSLFADPLTRGIGDGFEIPAPEVDASQDTLLWFDHGEQPTAGYYISTNATRAAVNGTMLVLEIELGEPAADAIVAQVVTRPCLVIKVGEQGLKTVHLIDAPTGRDTDENIVQLSE